MRLKLRPGQQASQEAKHQGWVKRGAHWDVVEAALVHQLVADRGQVADLLLQVLQQDCRGNAVSGAVRQHYCRQVLSAAALL